MDFCQGSTGDQECKIKPLVGNALKGSTQGAHVCGFQRDVQELLMVLIFQAVYFRVFLLVACDNFLTKFFLSFLCQFPVCRCSIGAKSERAEKGAAGL